MRLGFGANLRQLIHTCQFVVAYGQMGQIWKVLYPIQRSQSIVAQEKFLHFCKLEG